MTAGRLGIEPGQAQQFRDLLPQLLADVFLVVAVKAGGELGANARQPPTSTPR